MATIYEARPMKIRAIHNDVIVTDMDMGDQITASGIVVQSDDGKARGVKPRWGKVYKVGPEQKDIREGEWILIEHGRWTRGIEIDDGDGVKTIRRVDNNCILAVSNEEPGFEDDMVMGG